MVRRLLFVDDEVPILRALERMLRTHRRDWECHFIDDPLQALERLDEIQPDAIVSDMLMPGLDGAEFLTLAARQRPLMARFILSGEVGAGSLVRMARAAHQCLAKPCRGDLLMDVLRRALVEPTAVKVPALMEGLYSLQTLPIANPQFDGLRRLLGQPGSDARDAVAVSLVGGSAGIATKILQVATWTRLGMGLPPAHVHDAYYQLGPDAVCALLDSDLLKPVPGAETTAFQRETWRRAERTAAVGAAIARAEGFASDDVRQTSLVALWHASAPLLLDIACREAYAELRESTLEDGTAMHTLEHDHFGLTAGAAVAQLLRLWGLPTTLAAWVAQAEDVATLTPDRLAPDNLACIAGLVVDRLDGHGVPAPMQDYLDRLGCARRLDAWQVLAAGATEAVAA